MRPVTTAPPVDIWWTFAAHKQSARMQVVIALASYTDN